jgi:phage tail sheath protein FI
MPEYLSPGVYLEEVDTGSKPIEGVSTSTAGLIGVTERGPHDIPILVTSIGEFRRWFGDLLSDVEFTNATGPHCFLPHAVEGFFTNGGKRVFVTRVLRDDAAAATLNLFDRGAAASVATRLLRAAGQGTGTAVNQPLVSLLAPGTLGAGETIRIGDGSQSEYRALAAAPAASTHVPLAWPLAHSHDASVTIADIASARLDPPFTAALTLASNAAAGATRIAVTEGAAGEAAALAAGQVVEIGAAADAEHRRIDRVEGTGATRTLTLDAPLAAAYAAGATVTPLDLAGGTTTTLLAGASAGDPVVFGASLGGGFANPARLVAIDPGTPANVEVRRIGELHALPLARGAYDDYPRGSRVAHVATADDDRTILTAPPLTGLDTVQLDDVGGLAPGQQVIVEPAGGASAEPRVIRSVNAGASEVTFTAALANAHVASTPLGVQGKTLTAAAAAGDVTLALDNRLGLAVGDVARIGAPPNDEWATVASLTGGAGAPPNAGAVVLAAPLALSHPAGEPVRRQRVGPPPVVRQPAFLVLDAAPGDGTLLVSEDLAFGAGDVVQVTTPSGAQRVHALAAAAVAATPMDVELDAPLARSHAAGAPVMQRGALVRIDAIDPGRWGDRLRISVEDEENGLVSGATLATVNNPTDILLSSPTGIEPGTVLELAGPDEGDPVIAPLLKVDAINRANNRITLAGALTGAQLAAHAAAVAAGLRLRVRSREFRLAVLYLRRPDPAVPSRDETVVDRELFINLSMDPRHSRYFVRILGDIAGVPRLSDRRPEGSSWYVRAADLETVAANREAVRLGPEALVDLLPSGRTRPARHALTGGDDSVTLLGDADYVGVDAVDPEDRTGLQALKNIEEVSIVAAPGRTGATIQGALIAHCEEMRFRFAVLDAPQPPADTIADVRAQRQQFDTKYAALYHPWLLLPYPFPTAPGPVPLYPVPPSGHVVGIYARTDIQRGVHKAPANETVRGAFGLQRTLSNGEQDLLNPYPVNINVIRDFRPNSRGIRVWGARVITSDTDWKYVNVRRLLIFIEHSIERGLQWVVFEPNAEPLWARVRRVISNFLTTVWRNGALEGTKVEEAFFVKCDRTTMTQTDIDNGRLIVQVGVAPVKPAEFVIVRIGLFTAHAEE